MVWWDLVAAVFNERGAATRVAHRWFLYRCRAGYAVRYHSAAGSYSWEVARQAGIQRMRGIYREEA